LARRNLKIIAVGQAGRKFMRESAAAIGGSRVDFVVCDDIYRATAKLARLESGISLVVVAGLVDLRKADWRFADKAGRCGALCCCAVGADAVNINRRIEKLHMRGIVAAGGYADIVQAAEQWSEGVGAAVRDFEQESQQLGMDGFMPSPEEMDALFEGDFGDDDDEEFE